MQATAYKKPRHSLEAFDKLFERAFAPRTTLDLAPLSLGDDMKRPTVLGPSPPSPDRTQFYSPVMSEFPIDLHENSLDSVWDEVRQAKEAELASSPSKVQSLVGTAQSGSSQSATLRPDSGPQSPGRKRVTKKRSSVNFRESPDGRNTMVTFDMTGVKKQDMHVSFRSARLIVSWKVEHTAEGLEGDILVREREIKKYTYTIPLPEGTKFEEVRASRDSQRLTLTLPSVKCVRVSEGEDQQTQGPGTIPDLDRALSAVTEFYSCR